MLLQVKKMLKKKNSSQELKKFAYKIKKIIKNTKSGVMNIFICLIEMSLEELAEFF